MHQGQAGSDSRPCRPVDLNRICRRLGVAVKTRLPFYLNNRESRLKGLAMRLGDKRGIWVSSRLSEDEQRFVVAHELGHLVLDHPNICFIKEGQHDVARETEANLYAMKTLLPEEEMKTVLETGMKEREIANVFMVPVKWVRLRLAILGEALPVSAEQL